MLKRGIAIILALSIILIPIKAEAANRVSVSGSTVTITMSNNQKLTGKYVPSYRYIKWAKAYLREYPRTGNNVKVVVTRGTQVGRIWNNSKWTAVLYQKKCYFIENAALTQVPSLKCADWVSGSQISVRWTAVPGAEGYCLYRSRSKTGKYTRVATNKGVNNLRAIVSESRGSVGYYKVCTYNISGSETIYGRSSNIVICDTYAKSKLGYLFPSGPPTSDAAMRKYLVSVTLPVRTATGGKGTITLPIHKKLVNPVKSAFNDMYNIGFKVRKADTGSYNWRRMTTLPLQSHHSYGCVIDINWKANPLVTLSQIGKSAYNPSTNPYSINQKVVNIWKKYGFSWGGDWTEKKDYMHITYTNN